MTRKPAFWIILVLLGLGGSALAYRLFPVAFPILSVDVRMDRHAALDEARELAEGFGWGPGSFRQTASFGNLDPAFQTYMELEGGGLGELNRLVSEGEFSLFAWQVRHFAPKTVEEVEVRFSPEGEPLGFYHHLSEEEPGDNLDSEAARQLALAEASEHWGVDTTRFDFLESSQEERSGGRLDHTFVLERRDLTLQEGRVRLRLGVGGNRLVEVTPFLFVPDGFLRRYQETRDANESISLIGSLLFFLLFIGLGGGIGGVHLLKNRSMEWEGSPPLGRPHSRLMALSTVNSLPLAWMSYDTALSPRVFLATLLVLAGLMFVAGTLLLASIFMVGESLMRIGFPSRSSNGRSGRPGSGTPFHPWGGPEDRTSLWVWSWGSSSCSISPPVGF